MTTKKKIDELKDGDRYTVHGCEGTVSINNPETLKKFDSIAKLVALECDNGRVYFLAGKRWARLDW